MEYGTKTIKIMEYDQFLAITVIGLSILVGFILGTISALYVNMKENKELQKEVDKFRDLYFEEIDNWKNKYVDDDYEAY